MQSIHDALPVDEQELYWIQGIDQRFKGDNFFGIHPELPIEWFENHLKQSGTQHPAHSPDQQATGTVRGR